MFSPPLPAGPPAGSPPAVRSGLHPTVDSTFRDLLASSSTAPPPSAPTPAPTTPERGAPTPSTAETAPSPGRDPSPEADRRNPTPSQADSSPHGERTRTSADAEADPPSSLPTGREEHAGAGAPPENEPTGDEPTADDLTPPLPASLPAAAAPAAGTPAEEVALGPPTGEAEPEPTQRPTPAPGGARSAEAELGELPPRNGGELPAEERAGRAAGTSAEEHRPEPARGSAAAPLPGEESAAEPAKPPASPPAATPAGAVPHRADSPEAELPPPAPLNPMATEEAAVEEESLIPPRRLPAPAEDHPPANPRPPAHGQTPQRAAARETAAPPAANHGEAQAEAVDLPAAEEAEEPIAPRRAAPSPGSRPATNPQRELGLPGASSATGAASPAGSPAEGVPPGGAAMDLPEPPPFTSSGEAATSTAEAPGASPGVGEAGRVRGGALLHGPAAAETAADSPLTPSERHELVQRVARAVQHARDGDGVIRLRLNPPHLGSLRLELRVEGGQLTAQIETETPIARQMLLDQLHVLRDRLAQQSIRVERFEVELGHQHAQGEPHTPGDHQRRPSGENALPFPPEIPTPAEEAAAPPGPAAATHGWTPDGRRSLNLWV